MPFRKPCWNLTDQTAPTDYNFLQTGTKSDSTQQGYQNWISDAAADYSATSPVKGFASANFNYWSIITATTSAGCTIGNSGSSNGTGCTPGSVGSEGTTQEFLAFASPEPASFLLIGSGLVVGALFGRAAASEIEQLSFSRKLLAGPCLRGIH